jgi:hypothetical protein
MNASLPPRLLARRHLSQAHFTHGAGSNAPLFIATERSFLSLSDPTRTPPA